MTSITYTHLNHSFYFVSLSPVLLKTNMGDLFLLKWPFALLFLKIVICYIETLGKVDEAFAERSSCSVSTLGICRRHITLVPTLSSGHRPFHDSTQTVQES